MKKTAIALLLLASCNATRKPPPETTSGDGDQELTLEQATAGLAGQGKLMAEISTKIGTIHCELFPDKAPKTVASFVGLARGLRPWLDPKTGKWTKGAFFEGLTFHRVIPDFMIQGGDPLSRNPDDRAVGTGGPGYTLPDEIDPELKFDRPGRLAVANSGPRTHTGGSQFFITDVPYPSLDGGYVIFGQCADPEVVKAIAGVPRREDDRPVDAVKMQVRIVRQ